VIDKSAIRLRFEFNSSETIFRLWHMNRALNNRQPRQRAGRSWLSNNLEGAYRPFTDAVNP
jgi:hypothetical protein